MNKRRAMANSTNDRIRARVEQFAEELSVLIRESAMETVRDALGGVAQGRRGASGRSRPPAIPPSGRGGRGRAVAKGAKRAYVKFSEDTPAIDIATKLGLM